MRATALPCHKSNCWACHGAWATLALTGTAPSLQPRPPHTIATPMAARPCLSMSAIGTVVYGPTPSSVISPNCAIWGKVLLCLFLVKIVQTNWPILRVLPLVQRVLRTSCVGWDHSVLCLKAIVDGCLCSMVCLHRALRTWRRAFA